MVGSRAADRLYHDFGLKHICLFGVLLFYQFIGGFLFFWSENVEAERTAAERLTVLGRNRSAIADRLIADFIQLFPNLSAIDHSVPKLEFRLIVERRLRQFEHNFPQNLAKWDFWTAMLYAEMICTTIGGGFGHLYPITTLGRCLTVIYAIFGIPLVLTVLDDFGKLFIKFLNNLWFWTKRFRRIICCRKSVRLEEKMGNNDLPLSVAVFVVIVWISLCSATFCIWEKDWDYFIAFYFFFISLTTIGLGDISPKEPKYFLILFVYIIIGLSLVSMTLNILQGKFEKTYQKRLSIPNDSQRISRKRSSLGIFRSMGIVHSKETIRRRFAQKSTQNKVSQTELSFPSPTRNSAIARSITRDRIQVISRDFSMDDVMRLVDTEEGDFLLLAELPRDETLTSELSDAFRSELSSDSMAQIVISRSFDSAFSFPTLPLTMSIQQLDAGALGKPKGVISNCPATNPIPENLDLECLEELEDRLLLRRAASFDANPSVHFRSRLSLIMEQQSGNSGEEESPISSTEGPSNQSNGYESDEESESNKKPNGISNGGEQRSYLLAHLRPNSYRKNPYRAPNTPKVVRK